MRVLLVEAFARARWYIPGNQLTKRGTGEGGKHGEYAGWRHDQDQGGGARPIRRGNRRSGCADASLYQWLREPGLTQLICFPQLTAVAPDDPRVPMFQRQALAALSGEEANISDRFQTRCCIWSFED